MLPVASRLCLLQPDPILQASPHDPTSHPTANERSCDRRLYHRTPARRGDVGRFVRGIIDCRAGELIIFFRGLDLIMKSLQERMINKLESSAFKENLKLTQLTWRSLGNTS